MTYTIRVRRSVEVNTDPQRRCYDGQPFSSEWRWTAWEELEPISGANRVERRLAFWRELNNYAVSQRGKSALCEYEAVQES